MPELPVTTNRKPRGNSGHDKAESAVTMPESAVTFTGIRTQEERRASGGDMLYLVRTHPYLTMQVTPLARHPSSTLMTPATP